jgi:hypothetical protein
MAKMRLFGEPGWGSVIVEAQLDWYGLEFDFERVGDLFKSAESRERLSAVNPLAQIPTLVLADGAVLTESAAITLYLAELLGSDSLVPRAGDAALAGSFTSSRMSTRRTRTATTRRGSSTVPRRSVPSVSTSRPTERSSTRCSKAWPARRGFLGSASRRSTSTCVP